jgi:hypothetical protein
MLTAGLETVAFYVMNGTNGSGLPSRTYSKTSVFLDRAEICIDVSEAVPVSAWRADVVKNRREKSIIPQNTIIFLAVKGDA